MSGATGYKSVLVDGVGDVEGVVCDVGAGVSSGGGVSFGPEET